MIRTQNGVLKLKVIGGSRHKLPKKLRKMLHTEGNALELIAKWIRQKVLRRLRYAKKHGREYHRLLS